MCKLSVYMSVLVQPQILPTEKYLKKNENETHLELKAAGGSILPSLVAKPYCELLTEEHFIKQTSFSAAWINLTTSDRILGYEISSSMPKNGIHTIYLAC